MFRLVPSTCRSLLHLKSQNFAMRSSRAARIPALSRATKAGRRRQRSSGKNFRSSSAAHVDPRLHDPERIALEFPCLDDQAQNPSHQALVHAKEDANSDETEPNSSVSLVEASWCVYCLISANFDKTYVGVTSNLRRRIRQHNGELQGGSKATRGGRPWRIICTVQGFVTHSEACQFEWRWKDVSKKTSSAKVSSVDGSNVLKASLRQSHLVGKRQKALERVKSLKEWKGLNVKWYLDS